jgi:hypothetical protein
MIGWVVSQLHGNLIFRHKIHQTVDKLGAPTVILRLVFHVEDQGLHQWKAWVQIVAPQIFQSIHFPKRIFRRAVRSAKCEKSGLEGIDMQA